jgi:hypothetical protein
MGKKKMEPNPSVEISTFMQMFAGLDPVFQILLIVGAVAIIALSFTLVYYIIKGTLYLIYYILKGVAYLIYYILKGLYLLLKAIGQGIVKILEAFGNGVDHIINSNNTPEKVGARMLAIPNPKTVDAKRYCVMCGSIYTSMMEQALHEDGHCFCQNCGTKAVSH